MFAQEEIAQLQSSFPCAYMVLFLYKFWHLGLTQIIRPKQSYLYLFLTDSFLMPRGSVDYHVGFGDKARMIITNMPE